MKEVLLADKESLTIAKDFFSKGKVIFYPTDTIYGLGCLADCKKAVNQIFRLKGRSPKKSVIILISSWLMLSRIAMLSHKQKEYLKTQWPGPVTVILKSKVNWPWIMGDDDSIAVRLPNNLWLKRLIGSLGRPIVSTSANLSGAPVITSPEQLSLSLSTKKISLAVLAGSLDAKPSRIIDLRSFPDIKVIRP